jgi:hypothetical protein
MFKKWIKKIAGQGEELKVPSSQGPVEQTGAKELVINSSTQESPEPSDQSDSIQEKGMEAGAPRLGSLSA